MIHIAKEQHTEPDFVQLLEDSKQLGLQTINTLNAKTTGQGFEHFVVDLMKEATVLWKPIG